MKPGLYFDMPAEKYFADPCPEPSLSQSCATTLIAKSPAHAWLEHPRGGGMSREQTDAMARGTAMDNLLLGGDDIVIIDYDSFRTNAAKAARDEAIAAGKTPILSAQWESMKRARDTLRAKLADRGITFGGKKQVVAIWQSDGVWCRGRFDHLEGHVIDDLKCSESANPDEWSRKVMTYGYDIQSAAYCEAVEAHMPSLVGRVVYRLIVVEPKPPYAVCVMNLSGAFRMMGADRWKRAKQIWRRCLDEKSWPEYQDATLEPPPWAISDAINNAATQETPF